MSLITYLESLHFNSIFYGWFFLLIPLLIIVRFLFKKNSRSIASTALLVFSNSMFQPFIKSGWRERFAILPMILRLLVIALLVIVLMRPQQITGFIKSSSEVIDIMMVMDISTSMQWEDFTPNRLETAKKNAQQFIDQRQTDRIGLVVFGKEAFLQCPLTLDHNLLKTFINNIDFINSVSQQTAIGFALTTAIVALKDSEAKSKIIILVTDGENNAGDIDPFTAAEIAKKYNIHIYSIGIGKPGKSTVEKTIRDPFYGKRPITSLTVMDEESLKKISSITGGKYFNVQNESKFKETYETIDQLEKTIIQNERFQRYKEQFPLFLKIVFLLLFLEIVLAQTVFKRKAI